VVNAGYSYIPVFGGYKETNPETGEMYDAPSFEHSLLIPNQKPFTSKSHDEDQLVELGKKLAKKYQLESFCISPRVATIKATGLMPTVISPRNLRGCPLTILPRNFLPSYFIVKIRIKLIEDLRYFLKFTCFNHPGMPAKLTNVLVSNSLNFSSRYSPTIFLHFGHSCNIFK